MYVHALYMHVYVMGPPPVHVISSTLLFLLLAQGSVADDRVLQSPQREQEVPEVSSQRAPREGQEGVVEVRHHCSAGGGCQEEDQNVVMEAHEAAQVLHT